MSGMNWRAVCVERRKHGSGRGGRKSVERQLACRLLYYTPQGIPVTTFTVAVNERYGEKESTTWFRVSCWRQLAETTNQYLSKGRQVLIVGRIQARAYRDRNGEAAVSLDLTADKVQFLGTRGDASEHGPRPVSHTNGAGGHEPQPEDIPF